MSYKDMFCRYGYPSREADIRLSGWLILPEEIDSFQGVEHYDDSAAQLIDSAEKLIENLREYRKALAARYAALATMPSREQVSLLRHPGSPVVYEILCLTLYEDGTEMQTYQETFPGKERHAAFQRFSELRKEHPGAEVVKDIEKKPWEH